MYIEPFQKYGDSQKSKKVKESPISQGNHHYQKRLLPAPVKKTFLTQTCTYVLYIYTHIYTYTYPGRETRDFSRREKRRGYHPRLFNPRQSANSGSPVPLFPQLSLYPRIRACELAGWQPSHSHPQFSPIFLLSHHLQAEALLSPSLSPSPFPGTSRIGRGCSRPGRLSAPSV